MRYMMNIKYKGRKKNNRELMCVSFRIKDSQLLLLFFVAYINLCIVVEMKKKISSEIEFFELFIAFEQSTNKSNEI